MHHRRIATVDLVNLSVALIVDFLGLALVSLLPRDCMACLVRIGV